MTFAGPQVNSLLETLGEMPASRELSCISGFIPRLAICPVNRPKSAHFDVSGKVRFQMPILPYLRQDDAVLVSFGVSLVVRNISAE